MPQLPPEPAPGKPINASWGAAVVRYLRALTPRSSPTVRVNTTPGGTTLEGAAPAAPGNVSSQPKPFDLSLAAIAGDDDNLSATFWPGVINNILPSNYGETFTVSKIGTHYFLLTATMSGSSVTSAALSQSATGPAAVPVLANALPSTIGILLAMVIEGQPFQIRNGAITIYTREMFRAEKSPLVPGSLPYDSYWTWIY